MGAGYHSIPGKPGEFQSNALARFESHFQEGGVLRRERTIYSLVKRP